MKGVQSSTNSYVSYLPDGLRHAASIFSGWARALRYRVSNQTKDIQINTPDGLRRAASIFRNALCQSLL